MDTNWSAIVEDLCASGMTLKSIGAAIGQSTSAVSELRQGRTKEPNGSAALKLHSLHASRCEPAARKRRSGEKEAA